MSATAARARRDTIPAVYAPTAPAPGVRSVVLWRGPLARVSARHCTALDTLARSHGAYFDIGYLGGEAGEPEAWIVGTYTTGEDLTARRLAILPAVAWTLACYAPSE